MMLPAEIDVMRTTLNLDDDVYRAARTLAAARNVAIGSVLSELARRGLAATEEPAEEHGVPIFAVAETAPIFGADEVSRALDEP